MKKIALAFLTVLVCAGVRAQHPDTASPDKKTDWWGNPEGYLNQQAKVSLELAGSTLNANPPSLEESGLRKMALILIDNVMHDEKAPTRPAVQAFLNQRIEKAVDEISREKVLKGAVIWKLYDHAFVVRTPTVTLGFDIQRGLPAVEGFTISKDLMQRVIDQVDILFISHFHRDHADPWVAQAFLKQNKPVVTPPDLWKDSLFYGKINHPERDASLKHNIELPGKGVGISFVTCPGHQGEKVLNNVSLVFTPEGMVFAHTGDQSNQEDFSWIDRSGERYPVDVLMSNSWSVYPDFRLYRGFRPKLVLPGHENEMGHTIDHREPYWLNENRLNNPGIFPWLQMAWGEKYHYLPGARK